MLKSKNFKAKQNPFGIELYTKRELYESNERNRIDKIIKVDELKYDLIHPCEAKDVKFEIKYNRKRIPRKSVLSNHDKDSIDQMREEYEDGKDNENTFNTNYDSLLVSKSEIDHFKTRSIYDDDIPKN